MEAATALTEDKVLIREVWKDNLEQEIKLIRDIVQDFPYIAFDTEFPGLLYEPIFVHAKPEFSMVRANVEELKLIQVGLTLSTENGILPTCGTDKHCLWQFNFCDFNIDKDKHNPRSISFLISHGLDFQKFKEKGVCARDFSELVISSGLVLDDGVTWITFHSTYDFAFLLKVLSGQSLPDSREEYLELLKIYFPIAYDMKRMIEFCGLYGGLKKLADYLQVQRIGNAHQAGSDSLLTSAVFFQLKRKYFQDSIEQYAGVLYGFHDI